VAFGVAIRLALITGTACAVSEVAQAEDESSFEDVEQAIHRYFNQPAGDAEPLVHVSKIRPVSLHLYQDVSPLQPLVQSPSGPDLRTSGGYQSQLFQGGTPRSRLSFSPQRPGSRSAAGERLGIRPHSFAASESGELFSGSRSALGVTTQKRNPIISEPRIRGSRIGQLGASGSYWLPARIDLDTAVSKLDSKQLESVSIVKGPYAVRYGP